MGLVLWVSIFWGRILYIDLTYVALMYFGLYLCKINSIVSVPAGYFQIWDRRPSLLHIELFHSGASIFTRSLYPMIFPVVSQLMWCANGSTVIVYFFGIFVRNVV